MMICLLGRVRFGEETIKVEKTGKPYAFIISPAQYESFKSASKKRLFAILIRFKPVMHR